MAATNIHYAAAVLDITVVGGFCHGVLRIARCLSCGEVNIEERSLVGQEAPSVGMTTNN
jgi:hypothetical protein